MTRDEMKVLVKGMKAVYADPKFIADADAFEIWYQMLRDIDYRVANIAVQKHMTVNARPPAISDIRRQSAGVMAGDQLTGMEAWALVAKALRNGAYGYETEYEALPPAVQKAVGSAEQLHYWATDEEYNEGVTRSNFLRSYEVTARLEKETEMMPERIRQLTQETVKALKD